MVASGRGWGIGYMDEEAGLAYHSTISLSSVKARKARARDVGGCMAHSPRKGDRESWGEGGSMHSTISFSSALGLAMMEWQL
jgi:hypothetical protein